MFIRFRAFLVFQGGECLRNSREKVPATIERLNFIILRAVNEGKATKKVFQDVLLPLTTGVGKV